MTTTPNEPNGPTAPNELDRLRAERADLEQRIAGLEFERDGYYGEWQGTKNQLKRIRRSPAWLVWLAWVFLGRVLLWPIRRGFQLIGAVFRAIPGILARPYLMVWTWIARFRAHFRPSADEIPRPPAAPAAPSGGESAADTRPRVLIVMPYSIWPPHHGGAVRLYNLVRRLSSRCALHLLIFHQQGEDAEQRRALEPFCERIDFHHWVPRIERDRFGLEPPNALLFASDGAAAKIRDIVAGHRIHVVQLEYTELGQYISVVPQSIPVILTEHDIAFRSFGRRRKLGFPKRFAQGKAFGSTAADWRRLFRHELAVNDQATQIHTMSADDGRFLARHLRDGAIRIRVVPNGVDCDYYQPPDPPPERRGVLYVGNFENLPNVDALEFLVVDVWPLVRLRCPDAQLTVAGANTTDHIRGFHGRNGISVIGEVEDLRPVYHSHRVMVAPIRAGSGTRLKILEAFAAGTPVVSTTVGAEGIAYEDGRHLLVADEAGSFAEAVTRVLWDDDLAGSLAGEGLALARGQYDWRTVADTLCDCYEELLANLHPLSRQAPASILEDIASGGEPAAANPDVSIIIPTLNGGAVLEKCLGSIRAQQTELTTELICIDSGSRVADIEVMGRHDARVLRIDKADFNHGLTRDLAARHASGRVLVFLNQDAVPADEHWLQKLVEPLQDGADEVAAVQGAIRELPDHSQRFFWDSCGERFYFTSESVRWLKRHAGIGFSTVNAAIRRSVWERHPFGWAPIMEDKKWQREVADLGWEIVEAPDAVVLHTHDYDFRALLRRCRSEGFGWRALGERYTLGRALRDMLKPRVYRTLLGGVLRGRVRSSAELLFPWVRPLGLWWGNRFAGNVSL